MYQLLPSLKSAETFFSISAENHPLHLNLNTPLLQQSTKYSTNSTVISLAK